MSWNFPFLVSSTMPPTRLAASVDDFRIDVEDQHPWLGHVVIEAN